MLATIMAKTRKNRKPHKGSREVTASDTNCWVSGHPWRSGSDLNFSPEPAQDRIPKLDPLGKRVFGFYLESVPRQIQLDRPLLGIVTPSSGALLEELKE